MTFKVALVISGNLKVRYRLFEFFYFNTVDELNNSKEIFDIVISDQSLLINNYFLLPEGYNEDNIIEICKKWRFQELEFDENNTFVISLKKRNDRRHEVRKMLNDQNISFSFFDAIEDENGTLGCLKSHTKIVEMAKEKDLPYVWIMEDDCNLLRDFSITNLPPVWEMLFFGGAVNKIYEEYYYNWKKASNWYAHCYIIKKDIYDHIIKLSEELKDKKAIDEIYCEDMHPYINSYISFPTIASQRDNYSDIERMNLDRHQKVMNFDDLMNKKNPNPKWIGDIYCINLNTREDKFKHMNEICMKENIKIKFYQVEKNKNPARGCLESHLEIIKEAKDRNLPNILLLEDDVNFLNSLHKIEEKDIPEKWDMLYLGGNHYEVGSSYNESKKWYQVKSWSTYGYLVNSSLYDKLIEGLTNTTKEIDRYYLENIHPNYNVYMINPKIIVPETKFTYSDIEDKEVDYNFLTKDDQIYLENVKEENRVEETKNEDEILSEKDLPLISIITPTMNRRKFFKLSLYNFYNIDYPKDKIEWIIVDEGKEPLEKMIPKDDKRIKYMYISDEGRKYIFDEFINKKKEEVKSHKAGKVDKEKIIKKVNKKIFPQKVEYNDFIRRRIPIGMKRNIGVKMATNPVIVHMDDDDYYPSKSVYLRVSNLLKSGKQCVSCSAIASFNIVRMISMINVPPFDFTYEKRVSEASMCYYKDFWEKRKYNAKDISSEGESFLRNRVDLVKDLEWKDVIISLIHSQNFTSRSEMTEEPNGWHFGNVDDRFFLFLISLDKEGDNNDYANLFMSKFLENM